MKAVLDTNCVISGLFWRGPARAILDLARAQRVEVYTSLPMVLELSAVLARPKFESRLKAAHIDASTLVVGYASLAHVIKQTPAIAPVCRDPHDDEVLACALAVQADLIVSGDKDLLVLKCYGGTRIMSPSDAVALLLPGKTP